MSLPLPPEERYAKLREGVVALALLQRRGQRLLDENFMDDGLASGQLRSPGQGAKVLDHLRDVLQDLAEQSGIEAVFCVYCEGLVSSAEHSHEEIEDEAHHACSSRNQS